MEQNLSSKILIPESELLTLILHALLEACSAEKTDLECDHLDSFSGEIDKRAEGNG